MPGLDFGLDLDDMDEAELEEHFLAQVEPPSDYQRARIREYTASIANKFQEFSKPELSIDDETEIKEWIFDTFDTERANALLKLLHDRNTLTSTSTYREMVRLRGMISIFRHTLSGAAYGYTEEPPVLLADDRLRRMHITWSRNVDDQEMTVKEYREEQAIAYKATAAAKTDKLAKAVATEARRIDRVRDIEGGYVHADEDNRHAPCPQNWANQTSPARLTELTETLFSTPMDVDSDDGGPPMPEFAMDYTDIAERLSDTSDPQMVELVTLLKEVLSKAPEHEYDTISYQQFLGQFEQDLDDKCCDADQFIDGLGWLPGNCDCCAKHRPCSAVRHPPHERLYSWMIEGIVLKATSAWPKPTCLDWLAKYDLLAPSRSQQEFDELCQAGVWGADSALWPDSHEAEIATRAKTMKNIGQLLETEVHDLLKCVICGTEAYHTRYPDATDWDDWGERLRSIGRAAAPATDPVLAITAAELTAQLPEEPSFAQQA